VSVVTLSASEQEWFSIAQVRTMTGLSERTIRTLIRRGDIPTWRPTGPRGAHRIHRSSVAAIRAERSAKSGKALQS